MRKKKTKNQLRQLEELKEYCVYVLIYLMYPGGPSKNVLFVYLIIRNVYAIFRIEKAHVDQTILVLIYAVLISQHYFM
jgi:hypothetical protein